MDRKELSHLVATDNRYTVAALLAINEYQTEDEKMMGSTVYENGRGFNGVDAPFFSSLIDFYHIHGYLSPRQLFSIRKQLPKYLGQITGCELEPAPFKQIEEKKTNAVPAPPENSKKAIQVGEHLVITFQYDPQLVNKVKTLTDRRWNAEKKCWVAPICVDTVEKLQSWDFQIDQPVLDWLSKMKVKITDTPAAKITDIDGLKLKPFPYQLEGIQFIESRGGRALIGDEMGLGKTGQALAWLQMHPEIRPVVIVVPATLKLNWVKEIKLWMSDACSHHIISGRYNGEELPKADIYIINYDILAVQKGSKTLRGKNTPIYECRPDIEALRAPVLITDECHQYKNSDAQRTKAIKHIAKKTKHILALSGTPILNRPIEMFNALSIVEPKLFPSFFKYAQKYCGAVYNGYGWDFKGSSNTQELHQVLTETIMIRRLKADVLKDLPPKMRTVVPMELTNDKEYKKAENNFIAWVRGTLGEEKAKKAKNAEALTKIGELKRLAVKGKIDACIEWIEDFLESGEKLVVFAVHKFVIDAIMEKFKNIAVKVDGSVSTQDRQGSVDAFQNDDRIRLFVGNIKAAGVGITLTKASSTCFLELEWTPGIHDQAEDRVHRIGQDADSVNAYYLLAAGTMEETIAELIDSKRRVLSQVLDGKDIETDSMLSELLQKYSKGGQ